MFTRTFALTAVVALAAVAADLSFVTGAWGAYFEVGDKVVTKADAPLMDGDKRLATIDMNTNLTVEKVQGRWLLVVVERDGVKLRGYIQAAKVVHLKAYIDRLSEMLRSDPENGVIYRDRAIGYLHLGAADRAAAADIVEAIRLGVREGWLHAALGDFFHAQRDYHQAVQEYTLAIGLDAFHVESYINRGASYHELGAYDKALEDDNHAISLDRGCTNAYLNRGLIYLIRGEFERAITDFDKAIELNPSMSRAYTNRGLAWLDRRNYDKAIDDLSTAIGQDPRDADAHLGCGQAWLWKGVYDNAIGPFTQAILLAPDRADAFCFRGAAWQHKADYERAVADYEQAIRLKPDSLEAFWSRARANLALEEHDRAIDDYTAAIRLKPKDPVAFAQLHFERGKAYYAAKEIDKATADFAEAVRMGGQFPEARRGLAACYALQGFLEDAEKQYAAAWEEEHGAVPDSPPAVVWLGQCAPSHRPVRLGAYELVGGR